MQLSVCVFLILKT